MIVVVMNGSAGTGGDEDRAAQIRAAFAASGSDANVVEARGQELTRAARDAVRGGATTVVAAGGDGTVNAVAAALVGSTARLGVIPLGTLNHFARDLGIPLDLDGAVAVALRDDARAVDVATVNGRIFLNNSSIGVYPLMVRDRKQQQSRFRRSKWWAMLRASLAIFHRFPLFAVRLTIDGEIVVFRTPAVLIGNNVYALDLQYLGTRERLDAGMLAVYAVRSRTRWGVIKLLFHAIVGKLEDHDLFDVARTGELSLEMTADEVDVSLDGEVVRMTTPLQYRIVKRALQVLVPEAA